MIFNLGSICLSNFERLPAKEIVVIRGLFLVGLQFTTLLFITDACDAMGL